MTNQENAVLTCKAIKELANNEAALDNLQSYLTQHYDIWLEKYARTPDGLTAELTHFAHIEEGEADA